MKIYKQIGQIIHPFIHCTKNFAIFLISFFFFLKFYYNIGIRNIEYAVQHGYTLLCRNPLYSYWRIFFFFS